MARFADPVCATFFAPFLVRFIALVVRFAAFLVVALSSTPISVFADLVPTAASCAAFLNIFLSSAACLGDRSLLRLITICYPFNRLHHFRGDVAELLNSVNSV